MALDLCAALNFCCVYCLAGLLALYRTPVALHFRLILSLAFRLAAGGIVACLCLCAAVNLPFVGKLFDSEFPVVGTKAVPFVAVLRADVEGRAHLQIINVLRFRQKMLAAVTCFPREPTLLAQQLLLNLGEGVGVRVARVHGEGRNRISHGIIPLK